MTYIPAPTSSSDTAETVELLAAALTNRMVVGVRLDGDQIVVTHIPPGYPGVEREVSFFASGFGRILGDVVAL